MADAATAVRAGAGPIDGSMAPPRRWRAICELAWLESGRLLRHPLVMIGALVSVLSLWLASRGQPQPAPELVTGSGLVDEVLRRIGPGRLAALQLATLDTQVALVALLPATFMASNLAALRARRHATEELYSTAATAPWQRTAAHLLANGPIGLLALLLAGVSILLQARSAGAVGAPDPFELLAGPAAVVLAGALGVLLATWLRSALYGPVAVLGLAVIHFRLDGEHPRRWLSLIAGLKQGAVPADLLLRPSGLHLAYLAGLGALAGAAALLRHGPRRPVAIALALGLIATGATGAAQLDGPSAADRAHVRQVVDHPDRVQVCQRRGRVRYCAFPDYRSWIPRWQSATEAVLAPLPDGAVGDLTVRQSLAPWPYSPDLPGRVKTLRTDGNPWAVFPGEAQAAMGWGPGGGRPVLPRLRLEEQVALAALRLPNWPEFGNPSSTAPLCRATAVVALWLVVQADPQVRAVLRHTLALNYSFAVYQSGSRSFKLPSTWMSLGPPDGDELAWGWQALSYADQLARRPTGRGAITAAATLEAAQRFVHSACPGGRGLRAAAGPHDRAAARRARRGPGGGQQLGGRHRRGDAMLTGALRPRLLLALLPPTARAIDWRPVLLGGLLSLASLWLWGDQPDLTADQLFERVEVAAMIFAAAVAFVLDDPAATLTASSVSPLALRRAARALLLAPIAVAWWACAVLLADAVHPPVAVPAAPVVVEQAALVALTLGFAAAGSWRVADRLGGVVAGPALLGVTGAAYFGLPPRLALFVDPMDPQVWLPARWRWLALLVAGLLLALAASRDPARRRLGRRR